MTDFIHARLGRTLGGKYRLDRILGVGGMAAVYSATHRNRNRVAIKVLHPELSGNADVRARFLREGYVANTIDHQGAVSVLDDDVDEDGAAYLVMELLEGSSVEALRRQLGGTLPLVTLFDVAIQLLEVLEAAHARGVVHRDIKPDNLFLTDAGQLKLLDFGIARLHDIAGQKGTRTGMSMGTPGFMAPEQVMGETHAIDAQTDIWAVGATLFSLASGTLPHPGESANHLMILAASEPARPLSAVAPDTPAALAKVVDRALLRAREERWECATQMRQAVQAAREVCFGDSLPAATAMPLEAPVPGGMALATRDREGNEGATRPWGVPGWGLALVFAGVAMFGSLAVLALAAWSADQSAGEPQPKVEVHPSVDPDAHRAHAPVGGIAADGDLPLQAAGPRAAGARAPDSPAGHRPTEPGASGNAGDAVESGSPKTGVETETETATGPAPNRSVPRPAARPQRRQPAGHGPGATGGADRATTNGTCARLLEQLSLGAKLSEGDAERYARHCQKPD